MWAHGHGNLQTANTFHTIFRTDYCLLIFVSTNNFILPYICWFCPTFYMWGEEITYKDVCWTDSNSSKGALINNQNFWFEAKVDKVINLLCSNFSKLTLRKGWKVTSAMISILFIHIALQDFRQLFTRVCRISLQEYELQTCKVQNFIMRFIN
jgi:hypothetical protein